MSTRDADLKGSEGRLWALIEERTREGADHARIDQRIWDLFGEEWAVMFTDLAGFSRHVEAFGIIHFLQVIFEKKRLLHPIVAAGDGILIKVEADSFLLLFKRARAAIECAVAMQHACRDYSRSRAPEDRVLLCVGIGFGRVLRIGDSDVFGREVNAASKLGEDTAGADEILVTGATREAAGDLPGIAYEVLDADVPGSPKNFRVRY
ncbi:MAG: adenylate/guanylate cyclase domain-containing protein [Myxococcales bacterium]|nr:adenylate/guanylate cyclase domain-containing protein [Myxococcales bacterium]